MEKPLASYVKNAVIGLFCEINKSGIIFADNPLKSKASSLKGLRDLIKGIL